MTRVDRELRPADPRLWFECGIARGDSSTWCSLDVDTATAYAWPETWSGSAVPPYVGDEPWGWEPPGWSHTSTGTVEDDPGNTGTFDDPSWHLRGLVGRRRQPAAPPVHHGRDGHRPRVSAGRAGLLDPAARLRHGRPPHRSRPGGGLGDGDPRGTRFQPGDPDDALAGRGTARLDRVPRLVVWRAEASGGGFRQVYEASGPETYGGGLWVQDDVVYANGHGAAAVSDDGGLTWTTIHSWR